MTIPAETLAAPADPAGHDFAAIARAVIDAEIAGLQALRDGLDGAVAAAVEILLGIGGYCVVTGVGKSGHIARKIAATLASTGTPAFFVHPTDMSHGDLGMLRDDGALLAISNSGETRELRDALLYCSRNHIPIVGITGRRESRLGRAAAALLVLPRAEEACPNGLAPTTSTTMTLALGDAIAVALMTARGFRREDFGRRHPGGSLGLQLQPVADWMIDAPPTLPLLPPDSDMARIVSEVTRGRAGCAGVVDGEGRLCGMITDGDLRRAMQGDIARLRARDIMNPHPVTASPEMRMGDAIRVMTERRISNVFVVQDGRPVSLIQMKDLMQAGYLS